MYYIHILFQVKVFDVVSFNSKFMGQDDMVPYVLNFLTVIKQ